MGTPLKNSGRKTSPETLAAIEAARQRLATMTGQERDSMFASQKIGYIVSETCMGALEGEHSKDTALASLEDIHKALQDEHVASTTHHLGSKMRQLLPDTRKRLRERVQKQIGQLRANK